MGQNSDLAVGLGAVIVIIVIIVGVAVWVTSPEKPKSADQDKAAETQELGYMERFEIKEKEVLDLVKGYKGKGNSDMTLGEVVAMAVLVAYPDEKILDNPSTDWGWSALPVSGNPDTDKSWDAKFYLKTYKEDTSFEWIVDMETKTVYPKNENGKGILDLLEN